MKLKKNLVLFIFFSVLSIVLILIYAFSGKKSTRYDSLKIDKEKPFVYTKEEIKSDNYVQYMPYLNIKGESASLINSNIDEYMNSFHINHNIGMNYEFDINGQVLSLILKVEDHSYVESATVLYFRSYNINLETEEILADDTLLDYFDITRENVSIRFNEKLENYYNRLVSNKLISKSECDYSCFLERRKLNTNTDDMEFFVGDGKLVVYKPYTFISLSDKDEIVYGFEITD